MAEGPTGLSVTAGWSQLPVNFPMPKELFQKKLNKKMTLQWIIWPTAKGRVCIDSN